MSRNASGSPCIKAGVSTVDELASVTQVRVHDTLSGTVCVRALRLKLVSLDRYGPGDSGDAVDPDPICITITTCPGARQ